ncbi:hypothetical protein AG0111_0g9246 [Alternaria gaisen]|uniref:Uncharacterized protein n=1 Tax=Alternaria gaisen TaxID=167740 RepID=A0ACB6FDI5_9PLEO|nr:hypothetical protein AG0111_0g9246 [Alternaria gaisen]
MRLLDSRTLQLRTFYGDDIPPYAILSHTWLQDEDEVTHAQIQDPENCRHMMGFQKIEYTCQQAIRDGLNHAWIDTCCIDKTNSTELSEAINSMFQWYSNSKTCYVYLTDVSDQQNGNLMGSRWWSRAWTLQELLAPTDVRFYNVFWKRIGSKRDSILVIKFDTGIDEETLRSPRRMFDKSIAQRLSWAAGRKAKRTEDRAYSMLGILGVNMAMQYGEGSGAFTCLQEVILQDKNDQTLFAWNCVPKTISEIYDQIEKDESDITKLNGSWRMNMPLTHVKRRHITYKVGLLPCSYSDRPYHLLAILLQCWNSGNHYQRISPGRGVFTFLVNISFTKDLRTHRLWVHGSNWLTSHQKPLSDKQVKDYRSIRLRIRPNQDDWCFSSSEPKDATWSSSDMLLKVPSMPRHYASYDAEAASHSHFWQYHRYISRNFTGEGYRKYKQVLHQSDPESRKGFQDKVLLSLQYHTGAQINFALVLPVTPDMLSCGGDDIFNSSEVMVFAGDERDEDWIVRLEKAWNGASPTSRVGSIRASVTTRRVFNQLTSTLEIEDTKGNANLNHLEREARFYRNLGDKYERKRVQEEWRRLNDALTPVPTPPSISETPKSKLRLSTRWPSGTLRILGKDK